MAISKEQKERAREGLRWAKLQLKNGHTISKSSVIRKGSNAELLLKKDVAYYKKFLGYKPRKKKSNNFLGF